jgi:hypothetical protein
MVLRERLCIKNEGADFMEAVQPVMSVKFSSSADGLNGSMVSTAPAVAPPAGFTEQQLKESDAGR